MENRRVKVQVSNLTKKFGDLLVLNDVSFDVYDGEFLCIVGPTGCGKTTFLNSLTHLYEPTAGTILLDGEEIDLRKHNIAYIFQEYSVMEWLTVRQNVRLGLEIKKKKDIEKKVEEALELVGLKEFADYYPKQLSASMLQRVVIARAFATEPDLLLMDEPASALDPISTAKVEELISELRSQVTIVIVTHNMQQAARVSDRTAFFYMGEMVEYDDTKTIFTNPHKEATQNYITGRFG